MKHYIITLAAVALLCGCVAPGAPCTKEEAFAMGNETFREAMPEGSQMNFPLFNPDYVDVNDSILVVNSWTVVDGKQRYDFQVTCVCEPPKFIHRPKRDMLSATHLRYKPIN